MPTQFRNDEPTIEDSLSRKQFARALAKVAATCETPLNVGVFGTWGSGKTSLMAMVRRVLVDEFSLKTVWFNAWEYQRSANPAVGLAQAIVRDLDRENLEKAQKLAAVAGATLLGTLFGSISQSAVQDAGEQWEGERFLSENETQRLKKRIADLVSGSKSSPGPGSSSPRLVIFIDDLDRCLPEVVLPVLEALKLHLNNLDTVCFLGVDPQAIRAAIRHRYQGAADFSEVEYLDKIVQLHFDVPPIPRAEMNAYCRSLLPNDLAPAAELIGETLRRNPRSVKRFVNRLQLMNLFADGLDPKLLAGVQLLQHLDPILYVMAADTPQLAIDVADPDAEMEVVGRDGDPHPMKLPVLVLLRSLREKFNACGPKERARYFHFVGLSALDADEDGESGPDSQGFGIDSAAEPSEADLRFLSASELERHPSVDRLLGYPVLADDWFLLLGNRKQRTWLLRTKSNEIVCLLDDARTRRKDRIAQWFLPIGGITQTISARLSESGRGGRIRIGSRSGWLYSRTLYSDARELEQRLSAFINDGGAGSGHHPDE